MKLDRRVKWQQERKAKGLCVICGKRKLRFTRRCLKCNERMKMQRRAKKLLTLASQKD